MGKTGRGDCNGSVSDSRNNGGLDSGGISGCIIINLDRIVFIGCIGGKRGCATWVKSTSATNSAITYNLGHLIVILEALVSVGPDGLTDLDIKLV